MLQFLALRTMKHLSWISGVCLLFVLPAVAQVKLERNLEANLGYDDVSQIEVRLVEGRLTVKTWEAWQVSLHSRCQVTASDRATAEAYLDELTIERELTDEVARFQMAIPQGYQDTIEPIFEHTLYLPAEEIASLSLYQDRGDIQLKGLHGKWQIKLDDGTIELVEVTGAFHLAVKRGDVRGKILFSGASTFQVDEGSISLAILDPLPQPAQFTVGKGSVSLVIPENYPADIDVQIGQGRIENTMPLADIREQTSQRLRATFSQSGPPLTIQVKEGSIDLHPSFGESGISDQAEVPVDLLTVPMVAVPVIETAPSIDGWLNEAVWRRAGRVADFVVADGSRRAETITEGYVMRDATHLYLAARVHEPEMEQLQVSETSRGGQIWLDDYIEWSIAPADNVYYDILVNPLGTVLDQRIADPPTMNSEAEMLQTGVNNLDWDSRIKVQTRFSLDAWYVEAAIPLSVLGSAEDTWGFNIHRFRTRTQEHTYWAPTYLDQDSADIAYAPELFGRLEFTESREDISWKLQEVRISGNDSIDEDRIIRWLGWIPGQEIFPQELPELEQSLRDTGWFSAVAVRFEPSEAAIILDIEVQEWELLRVDQVEFAGNVRFNTGFLKGRFGWSHPRMAPASFWDAQCRIVENLYRAHDYPLASVHWQWDAGKLSVQIDEGILDAILIEGAERISEKQIRAVLDIPRDEPYRESLAQKRKEALLDFLQAQPAFERLQEWRLIHEDGQKVLLISIRERAGIQRDLAPLIDFNRVQGLALGGNLQLSANVSDDGRLFGMASYGFSNRRWNYLVGVDKSWFDKHRTNLGFHVHRLTDSPDFGLISRNEGFLAALLWGESYQDYYQREGITGWIYQKLTPSTAFQVELSHDEHVHLLKTTDWSLFRRDFPKRSNRRIWNGRLHTVRFAYLFDSRNAQSYMTRYFQELPIPTIETTVGWLGFFRYEKAGDALGGDFTYERAEFQITRYQKLSDAYAFDIRLMGSLADSTLPPQKRVYLGGIGTLRGYEFKEWVGDNMLLGNLDWQWWFSKGRALAIFADIGYVWQHTGAFEPEDTRVSLGVGLIVGDLLRLDLARPLESGRDPALLIRLERMF